MSNFWIVAAFAFLLWSLPLVVFAVMRRGDFAMVYLLSTVWYAVVIWAASWARDWVRGSSTTDLGDEGEP